MHGMTLILVLLIFAFVSYQLGMRRSLAVVKGKVRQRHSLPSYYGYHSALWAMFPVFLVKGKDVRHEPLETVELASM